ncbi:IMP cyclohydrolase [Methanothermococcus sp. SCGC AD-155-N22]|nr:IMP cyclohydrolase [Methanothermococcus sp. SCGC AD-155-N22]
MYIGRFLVMGKTENGKPFISYRVSSRSFPNRRAVLKNNTVTIVPENIEDILKNPYIMYNALKVIGNYVVATNGSHTDVIGDKIEIGYPVRDALIYSLATMDYEKDEYKTPRIAGILYREGGYLGYVSDRDIRVCEVPLKDGIGYYLGTYGVCSISEDQKIPVVGETSREICKYILEYKEFEHPVCCATALIDGDKIEMEVLNLR